MQRTLWRRLRRLERAHGLSLGPFHVFKKVTDDQLKKVYNAITKGDWDGLPFFLDVAKFNIPNYNYVIRAYNRSLRMSGSKEPPLPLMEAKESNRYDPPSLDEERVS